MRVVLLGPFYLRAAQAQRSRSKGPPPAASFSGRGWLFAGAMRAAPLPRLARYLRRLRRLWSASTLADQLPGMGALMRTFAIASPTASYAIPTP